MQVVRRIVGSGLGSLGGTVLSTRIWSAVTGLVTGLWVTALCTGSGVLAVLGGQWAGVELACRRELRATGRVSVEQAVAPEPVVPVWAELWRSA